MRRPKVENCLTRRGLVAPIFLVGFLLAGGFACPAVADEVKPSARATLPADLDLVPRDAAGFVHFRAADLWHGDWAKDIRYLVDRAGPEAWKAFEKKCPLDPSTLDRITLILPAPQTIGDPFPSVDPEAVSALVVVTTNRPYNRLSLVQALGPREKVYRDHLYYFNEEMWSGLVVVDERTFLFGSEDALVRYFDLSRHPSRTGPLDAALAAAAGKHQIVVGLNPTLLGKEKGAEFMPPPVRKLLTADCGILTLDLDHGIHLDVRLDFPNAEQAREGETALRQTLDLGRQGLAQPIAELEKVLHDATKSSTGDLAENFGALVALGFLRELDTQLQQAAIERQELTVKLPFTYRKLEAIQPLFISYFGMFAIGRSAVGNFNFVATKVAAGGIAKDPIEEHLRNLSQAMDKYRAEHGTYPPRAIYDREGRPVLSWRVALLPYLGEEGLYHGFRLDEPWDSLHNKRLLKKLPQALRSPNQPGWGSGRWKTVTQVFAGDNTLFDGKKGAPQPDAAKKVILLAHLNNDAGVYWTKPADLAYAADKPLPNLFGRFGSEFKVLLTDGSYRGIDKAMEEKTLRALIERGERKTTEEARSPQPKDLESIWKDLIQNDEEGTRLAWQDIAVMIKSPGQTVPYVKERVKPVPPADPKRIAQYLTDLDSKNFKTREKAVTELEKFGELALPSIEKKLNDKKLSLEARRHLETLVQKTKTVLSADELRTLRVVTVLEQIGTPEARAVLDILAGGARGTVLTEEARRALERLSRRDSGK